MLRSNVATPVEPDSEHPIDGAQPQAAEASAIQNCDLVTSAMSLSSSSARLRNRQGFRLYWRWRSRSGRKPMHTETRKLIRQMCLANSLWGAPRIHGELLKLTIKISKATVAKYVLRRQHSPSPTWRSFLRNQALGVAAIDMFIVPSATFQLLFVMLILAHDRRQIVASMSPSIRRLVGCHVR